MVELKYIQGFEAVAPGNSPSIPASNVITPVQTAERPTVRAGQQIVRIVADPNALSPRVGFAAFCGYTVALMAIAAVLMRRRDA
jgi:hypothetical protein